MDAILSWASLWHSPTKGGWSCYWDVLFSTKLISRVWEWFLISLTACSGFFPRICTNPFWNWFIYISADTIWLHVLWQDKINKSRACALETYRPGNESWNRHFQVCDPRQVIPSLVLSPLNMFFYERAKKHIQFLKHKGFLVNSNLYYKDVFYYIN